MHPKQIIRTSRKISLVLRHKPEAIGISLDENGWAGVDELLRLMTKSGTPLTRPELETIVAENNKKRFRFNDDGTKIRANQGHSLKVDLQMKAVQPPTVLYHGTATTAVASILKTGLEKRKRQHVHLSHEQVTATQVGGRHGKPVILTVDAARMVTDGYLFYRSDNGVWLTDNVPPAYLSL